jgi:hypothetical protein
VSATQKKENLCTSLLQLEKMSHGLNPLYEYIHGMHSGKKGAETVTFLKDSILPGTIENFEKAGWPRSGIYGRYSLGEVSPSTLLEWSISMSKDKQ